MGSRLAALRKALGLNQSKFAERLGLTHSAISQIESGKNALTDTNINLICLTFQVNEAWLRTGNGPMFGEEAPEERELLGIFRSLTPALRKTILEITRSLLDAQEKAER